MPRHDSALRGLMRSRSPSRRSPGFGPAFRDDRAVPSADVFDIQRQPVPVGSVGADTRLCCLSSRGRVGGVATEWSSAPRCPATRSVFHCGMRCSTVLASMPATAHRRGSAPRGRRRHGGPSSDEETPVSDQYDGPQTVRAGPRSNPHGDRADDVEGAPRLQPASPVSLADASPCSTVLPEMVRLPPVAWVISIRRG